MAATYRTKQEVLDGFAAAFDVRNRFISYANTGLVDRTSAYNVPLNGVGHEIFVRRRSTTRGQVINVTGLTGAISKVKSNIEQQTISVNVNQFYYAEFDINSVEGKLFVNGKSADDETVMAATDDLHFNVNKFLYDGLIKNANILALSPSTSLSNQNTLGQVSTIANHHNMPERRCLTISQTAATDLQSHFGTYFNNKASNPALSNQSFSAGYFQDVGGDNVVTKFITGTAHTLNGQTDRITVNSTVNNGDTTVDLINDSASSKTINVGEPMTFDESNISAVARGTFQIIDRSISKPSVIIAEGVDGQNGYVAANRQYTVGAGASIVVTIEQSVDLSGNFQTVKSPNDEIEAGADLTFYDDHYVSFMLSDTGLSFAAPKLQKIENAEAMYSSYNQLNFRFQTQGDLGNEVNTNEIAALYGAGYDPAYLVRVMSNN